MTPEPIAAPEGTPSAAPAFTPEAQFFIDDSARLVAEGKLSAEQRVRDLREAGIDIGDTSDAQQAAAEAEDDPLHVAGKVGQFEIPTEGIADEKLAFEVAQQANVFFADMGVSTGQGNAMAKEIARVHAETEHMTPGELALWTQKQQVALERLWGPQAVENLALARQLCAELCEKHPKLRDVLEESRAGDSPAVISAFYFRAKQLQARQKS